MARRTRRPLRDSRRGASYLLIVEVRGGLDLRAARGVWTLPSGYYVYVGSANITRPYLRVLRHLSPVKRRRWHVDYLTADPNARALGGIVLYGVSEDELYVAALGSGSLEAAAPGFGSSDKGAHVTHLFRIRSRGLPSALRELLDLARRLGPSSIELLLDPAPISST